LALLGRLSWERVDGFVMQASEKPAQERSFADDCRIADFDPLRKFGSAFSMTGLTQIGYRCAGRQRMTSCVAMRAAGNLFL
jgi:hypothetical protein